MKLPRIRQRKAYWKYAFQDLIKAFKVSGKTEDNRINFEAYSYLSFFKLRKFYKQWFNFTGKEKKALFVKSNLWCFINIYSY